MIVLVEYLINKVAGLPKACNLIKKRLQHKCFLVAFEKFLRTPFFTGTSRGCLCKYSFQSQNVRYLLLVNHYTYPILELQIYQVLMLYKFMIAYHKHISSSLIKNYVCTKNNSWKVIKLQWRSARIIIFQIRKKQFLSGYTPSLFSTGLEPLEMQIKFTWTFPWLSVVFRGKFFRKSYTL